ncbi:MAG TPA: MFS transporter [Kofleriaceae bacterium]|nr:MFS transporter [Kofleriaceae bacterium]
MLARGRRELLVIAWGATAFAAVLASYFVFRPVRDALVLDGRPEDIPWLFTATFVAVLIVSPAWSALLARGGGRRRYVPLAFHAFAICALGFAALVHSELAPVAVGRVFYVWSAVFNLFVVSVFWSLLADLLGPDVAKRLYGPIAAGGTAGAFFGPLLTRELVGVIGVHGILFLSAALLELGAAALFMLRRAGEDLERTGVSGGAPVRDDEPPEPAFPAALRGLARLRDPYLLSIVGYVLCTATAATFMYLEQASIVKELVPTREAHTKLFATIDFWVNLCTFLAQIVLAPVLLARFGPGLVLLVLPLAQGIGITALALAPSIATLMAAQIATRTATHGLTRPARELLFTVVGRDDKYRAKHAIDTVVYRFGDFGSSWLHRGLVSLGAGSTALVAAAWPLVAAWLALATALGIGFRHRRRRAAASSTDPSADPPADPSAREEPA